MFKDNRLFGAKYRHSDHFSQLHVERNQNNVLLNWIPYYSMGLNLGTT